jgi:hydrogenase maturation protein HypF
MRPAAKLIVKEHLERLRVTIHGAVQGVGFRPFVYRLAGELNLNGWVNNSSQGVFIEVEGAPDKLKSFLLRLERECPPRSFIQSLESSFLDAAGFTDFQIRQSDEDGAKTAIVLPDIAVCDECLSEIFDSQNRRYLYPFTNCTNCGPRFSIIESLPYDRRHTTMKIFKMCAECRAEYENPLDRRFHAQPNACPTCGPHLELWDADGKILTANYSALKEAAEAINGGKIVAVKGLGGFHLIADARQKKTVQELRQRKHREEKPFALMFPSLAEIEKQCEVSELEKRLLTAPESPIVLLKRKIRGSEISEIIAPGNPYLGAMLPYTPLHHLLMHEVGFAVVATSGNLSDEPICTDEREALERLKGIADLFLVHNRPIARHVDDSIAREMAGREMVLRRARGYAPLPVQLKNETPAPVLAVGAHLKNSVATAVGRQTFISQHIGDLETAPAFRAFENVIESFKKLYEILPERIACDAHPDYLSTHYARDSALPTLAVQHHYAHVLSCMAENALDAPVLGIAWDGTGYGADGTIWGGEFLLVGENDFERAAHFRTFRLPGGDKAVKEPRRAALGVLYEIFGDEVFSMKEITSVAAFTKSERSVIRKMLANDLNAPRTSSAGRLFDAAASIIGLRQTVGFEGQAAMELEFLASEAETDKSYLFGVCKCRSSAAMVDWKPVFCEMLDDLQRKVSRSQIAAKFHNTLVEMMVAVARTVGEKSVALSGGCFQNKILLERAVRRLTEENFNVYRHQRVPTNDGGIALGQILAIVREKEKAKKNA